MADILILTSDFPPLKGGIAADSFSLFELLNKKHNVTVHVFGVRAADTDRIKHHNIPKALYPFVLKRIFRESKFDAVLVRTVLPLGWMLNLTGHNGKLVHFIYGQECIAGKGFKPRPTVRKIIKNADTVIANSEFTSNLSGAECGVFYPLIEDEPGQTGPANEHKGGKKALIIGSAGRLVRHKNFIEIIKMMPEIDRTVYSATGMHVEYHITGKGPEENHWKAEASKSGAEGMVKFLGEKNAVEMDSFYRSIDILAVPSIMTDTSVEGFGMVVQEAAVRMVPSAGFKSGGVAESISDSEMLADEGDSESLMRILIKTLSDEAYRKLKAESAHEHSKKFLMSESRLNDFEKLIGI